MSYFIAEDPVAAQRIDSAQQLQEVQEDLVQSEWSTAQWYLRSGDPVSAAYEVSRLADRYADKCADAGAALEDVQRQAGPIAASFSPPHSR